MHTLTFVEFLIVVPRNYYRELKKISLVELHEIDFVSPILV